MGSFAPKGMGGLKKPPVRVWSPRQYRRWAALAFALPFLILLGMEGVLRLLGWGGYLPFLRVSGQLPTGEEVCLVEPAASKPWRTVTVYRLLTSPEPVPPLIVA